MFAYKQYWGTFKQLLQWKISKYYIFLGVCVCVHVLSSADVARRLMLTAKQDEWQFVVKTWR
jgi:hypothetical protein